MPSRAILICAYCSLLLAFAIFMALVHCPPMHGCTVHGFVGFRTISQVQIMTRKGRFFYCMWKSFLRQVFQNQALLVTILTNLAQNVAIFRSDRHGTVCTLSDHRFRLVHKVCWHKELIFSRIQ